MNPIPQASSADIATQKRLWTVITGAKEMGFVAIINVCRIGRLITYLSYNPIERVPRDDHRHGEGGSERSDSPLVAERTVKMRKHLDDSRLKKDDVDAAQP